MVIPDIPCMVGKNTAKGLQEQARQSTMISLLIGITETISSTPTAAFETLLDLPPLIQLILYEVNSGLVLNGVDNTVKLICVSVYAILTERNQLKTHLFSIPLLLHEVHFITVYINRYISFSHQELVKSIYSISSNYVAIIFYKILHLWLNNYSSYLYYNRQLPERFNPVVFKISGCLNGKLIVLIISCLTSFKPPTSDHCT